MRIGVVSLWAIVIIGCGNSSSMCQMQGEGCTPQATCCTGSTCTNAICVASSTSTCQMTGQQCIVTNAGGNNCCSGSTCARFAMTCQLGDVGDPCQKSAQCKATLTCNSLWCTKSCATDADCGGANYCIETAQGGGCFPACAAANQTCVIYPGATCKTVMTPQGLGLPACSL